MCRGSQLTAAALSLPSCPCCVNSAAWLRAGRGGQTQRCSPWPLGSTPAALPYHNLQGPGPFLL